MNIKKKHFILPLSVMAVVIIVALCFIFLHKTQVTGTKPNIIVIIADDLGRNDVGFYGSSQIPTPNIDALAYNGIILDRFYTQCTCTPSRTAFLTGNYPIRSGMQGYPLKAGENRSLSLNMATMPERMKKLGYKTHLVGKWHLGAAYRKNTPIGRGFDTHFGYWMGFVGYFDYLTFARFPNGTEIFGLDIHDGFRPVWSARGKYATELFTEKTLKILDDHDKEEPLFLVLSHLAPHTGSDGVELGVPNVTTTNIKYSYIQDPRRRLYADVVNLMDDSVGRVIKKLADRQMLENSIVLFFSDNGGQTIGMYENTGSNWPLRGVKFSDFEGGIRSVAAIFSPLFQKKGYVNSNLIHLTDWLPTFYAAAGGNLGDLGKIDGINQWSALSEKVPSNRTEILVNIDEVDNTSTIITDNGRYKLLQGSFEGGLYDKYYGESGRGPEVPPYSHQKILQSTTNQAILNIINSTITGDQIEKLKSQTNLAWCRSTDYGPDINCTNGCLFNLETDPCETTNIIEENVEIVKRLYRKLEDFAKEVVPQTNKDTDPDSYPFYYNGTWCTWLDDELCSKTNNDINKNR